MQPGTTHKFVTIAVFLAGACCAPFLQYGREGMSGQFAECFRRPRSWHGRPSSAPNQNPCYGSQQQQYVCAPYMPPHCPTVACPDVCGSNIPSTCTIKSGTRLRAPVSGTATLERGGVLVGGGSVNGSITGIGELEGPGTFALGATISGRIASSDGTMTDGTFQGNSSISNASITTSATLSGTAELAPGSVVTADLTNSNGQVTDGVLAPSSEITNATISGQGSIDAEAVLTNSSGSNQVFEVTNPGQLSFFLTLQPGEAAILVGTEGEGLLSGSMTLSNANVISSGTGDTTFTGVVTGPAITTGTSTVGASGGTATDATLTDPAAVISGTADIPPGAQFTGTTVVSGPVSMQGGTATSSGTISDVRITEQATLTGRVLVVPGTRINSRITGAGTIDGGTLASNATVSSEHLQCSRSLC